MPARLTVGLVRGLRGLQGHVRVELLTDRPEERFRVGGILYPEGSGRALHIAESAPVADGPGWWLRFREAPTRDAAETLRDTYLEIAEPDEPREAGRWYFHELTGLAVRSTAGTDLGRVVDVYRAGGAEVFLVRGPRGELDIPAVEGIVTVLEPEGVGVVVDLDALDLDARPVDDEDYVRPRDRRPQPKPRGPKGPAQPPKGTGPVRRPRPKGGAGKAVGGNAGSDNAGPGASGPGDAGSGTPGPDSGAPRSTA